MNNYIPELIKIPKGKFVMGTDEYIIRKYIKVFPEINSNLFLRELPQHEVFLLSFYISKYPIQNYQFEYFVKDTNYLTTAEKVGSGFVFTPTFEEVKGASWKNPKGPNTTLKNKDNHPAVQISWCDALEYCKWLSQKTNMHFRLPTEAEWEKTARGVSGLTYTWGNDWINSNCNGNNISNDTTPVDKFSPNGDSPFGCSDMCGNIFEWTSTSIGNSDPWPSKYTYPYNFLDGRENLTDLKSRRVGRGGSYNRSYIYCRTTFRFADNPFDRYSTQGFRVACDI